uniref:MFS transporter n=1 Tax=Schlesneria paludicola TaxID=360056 RepID=A0A7C2NY52_9PLAN
MVESAATPAPSKADGPRPQPAGLFATERGVVWMLWLTYGVFYFCRTNISAAVPGLKGSVAEGGLGLPGDEVGWILASLKIAYGLGQLVNGQLSERVSPRIMLAVGMFGSAALNVVFGFSTSFYFLMFVWALNGFCQSLGWTPCVRVAANWVPVIRRGHAIGLIGTGYQITLGLTYVIAGQSAEYLGWRGALFVPAALLALTGVFMLIGLRDAPTEDDHAAQPATAPLPALAPRLPFTESLYWTLYNPALWQLGLALGLLNACRYGFLDWGVAHLIETQDVKVGKAGLQFFVIAIGATAGSYLAGWATDRFFGSRRAPVICLLMALLGGLSLIYDEVVQRSALGTMLLLVIIGFCIYGPQVLLVGTAPADLAHRGTSAAAAGFVNFMGYMGAATGDVVTGYYSAPEQGGWQVAIYIWAAWAFAGSIITAVLWNTTSRRIGVLSGAIPKLGAIALLALAMGASYWGRQPWLLQVATACATVCLPGAFASRWSAVPALVVALAGVPVVFASVVLHKDGTWDQTTAIVAYGLAGIASLMILVERKSESCASL